MIDFCNKQERRWNYVLISAFFLTFNKGIQICYLRSWLFNTGFILILSTRCCDKKWLRVTATDSSSVLCITVYHLVCSWKPNKQWAHIEWEYLFAKDRLNNDLTIAIKIPDDAIATLLLVLTWKNKKEILFSSDRLSLEGGSEPDIQLLSWMSESRRFLLVRQHCISNICEREKNC